MKLAVSYCNNVPIKFLFFTCETFETKQDQLRLETHVQTSVWLRFEHIKVDSHFIVLIVDVF